MKLYQGNNVVRVRIYSHDKIKKEVKIIIESLLKKYPNDQNYRIQVTINNKLYDLELSYTRKEIDAYVSDEWWSGTTYDNIKFDDKIKGYKVSSNNIKKLI